MSLRVGEFRSRQLGGRQAPNETGRAHLTAVTDVRRLREGGGGGLQGFRLSI